MQVSQPIISPKQTRQLCTMGWNRLGKKLLADVQKEMVQLCHPHFADKRYAIFIEHQTAVVDANGDTAQPVLAMIVTAPNIRAARKAVVAQFPGHIRRFLDWKELPLYPTDEQDAA